MKMKVKSKVKVTRPGKFTLFQNLHNTHQQYSYPATSTISPKHLHNTFTAPLQHPHNTSTTPPHNTYKARVQGFWVPGGRVHGPLQGSRVSRLRTKALGFKLRLMGLDIK